MLWRFLVKFTIGNKSDNTSTLQQHIIGKHHDMKHQVSN